MQKRAFGATELGVREKNAIFAVQKTAETGSASGGQTIVKMRKIKNMWLSKKGYDCFGCSPDNPLGVKMEFCEDGDDVVCLWKPQAHYQGWIDTLHGGIQATLIDECASWVMFRRLQTTGVTSKLEIRYRKAVMTTEPQITIRARLKEMRRNLACIAVTVENSKGELCTEGEALYFTFPKEKAVEMGFTRCETEQDA